MPLIFVRIRTRQYAHTKSVCWFIFVYTFCSYYVFESQFQYHFIDLFVMCPAYIFIFFSLVLTLFFAEYCKLLLSYCSNDILSIQYKLEASPLPVSMEDSSQVERLLQRKYLIFIKNLVLWESNTKICRLSGNYELF